MKDTMNNRDIAKFHKLLDAEVSMKKCSDSLGVSVKALNKFTPDAIKKAKVKDAPQKEAPKAS
jgi:hypothetical protein